MTTLAKPTPEIHERAQGCLLGQLAGDALGSLVKFQSPEQIRRAYPAGLRELAEGGTWNTIAGQPTDDSEMALMLARALVDQGRYDRKTARQAYVDWLESGPFDCGYTVSSGLRGRHNPDSQAGWALVAMRNALWQLMNAENLKEAVIDSVMRGGDADTNAAITGALVGAVQGRRAIPDQWEKTILNCLYEAGRPGVQRPRPQHFLPVDALELAEGLIGSV